MGRLHFVLLVGLVSFAFAEEAEEAPPRRWTHARGPASLGGRSLAASPEGTGRWIWSYDAKSEIVTTPLVWDDAVFLVDGRTLVAVDARLGKVLARTSIENAAKTARPAVHARAVFVREKEVLAQYQLSGRKFLRRWEFEVGDGASDPTIHAGEIYVTTPKGLLRLRAAVPEPVWTAGGHWTGQPAVTGDHVYAMRRDDDQLKLVAVARKDGKAVAEAPLGSGPGLRVAISRRNAAVEIAPGRWALLQRTNKKGEISLEFHRVTQLRDEPLVGGRALIGRPVKNDAWALLRPTKRGGRNNLVTPKDRKDLFDGTAAPVSLNGGTIAFGPWCVDININRILWNVRDTQRFQAGTRFASVPVDHYRVLLVTTNGKRVSLFGPEDME
ncbi:MAG: PQQ-like beta-propeller repeat protein [Planctomycetota bacterium]|nr:PQQ-like beta-propeller repeat protein [Planctomycetota bacterium]